MDERQWNSEAHQALVGSRITRAEYMSADEAERQGYRNRPLKLTLDNGLELWPIADDEGTDAGAFECPQANTGGFPVL